LAAAGLTVQGFADLIASHLSPSSRTWFIAPVLCPAWDEPVFLVIFVFLYAERRAERLGGKPRPRRPHVVPCEHPVSLSAGGRRFNPSPKNDE
jgi:hypothetical protein